MVLLADEDESVRTNTAFGIQLVNSQGQCRDSFQPSAFVFLKLLYDDMIMSE